MTNDRIVVNIGNSRIAHGSFVSGKLVALFYDFSVNIEQVGMAVVEKAKSMPACQIAVCSVVPSLTDLLLSYLAKENLDVFLIETETQAAIKNVYPTLGTDRIANLVAALKLYAPTKTAIVVDMGTATTLSAAGPDYHFLGGMITLGVGRTYSALAEVAQLRERLDQNLQIQGDQPAPLALNTESAITSGCLLGHVGIVDYWVKAAKSALNRECAVIATGGYANLIAPHAKVFDHVDPHLTIYGINFIADAAAVLKDRQ